MVGFNLIIVCFYTKDNKTKYQIPNTKETNSPKIKNI